MRDDEMKRKINRVQKQLLNKQGGNPNRGTNTIRDNRSSNNPNTTISDSFYDENGCLKKEVFIGVPEILANTFGMSSTSIRALYNFLKDLDNNIKIQSNKDDIPDCKVSEVYLEFHRGCIDRNKKKQKTVSDNFLRFVEDHLELATRNKEEFHGFVELLTSIIVRMRK